MKFKSGNVENKKIKIKFFGSSASADTLEKFPPISAVIVFSIESTEIKADSFSANISFEYNDALLAEAGVIESDIIIAYYDENKSIWASTPTIVDTVEKIASAEITHFSIWILTDSNQVNIVTGIAEEQNENIIPTEFMLYRNYPNPFNAETIIKYRIPKSAEITLKIYNMMGQEIAALLNNQFKQAGSYTLKWNGRNRFNLPVSSGVYFYIFKADKKYIAVKKMIYLK